MPRNSRKTLKNPLAIHYECADGKWLLFSEAQSDRFWHSFCDALDVGKIEKDPKFATAKDRRENYQEIREILEKVFKTKKRQEWIDIFNKKGEGIAFSPVLDLSELASDPQVTKNDYIIDYNHPNLGNINLIGYPIKFSHTPASVRQLAPGFGQHTEEVLIDLLGLSWEDIAKLKDEEVI